MSAAQDSGMEWVIPPEPGQIGKNIHFVVDFSGSMDSAKISQAIKQTLDIASQSVDEINIKVTVFGETYATWEGVKNEKQPGWTALPSKEAIDALSSWMTNVVIDNNNTYVAPPVGMALVEDIEGLTVIVISDMGFTDGSLVYKQIEDIQRFRTYPATFGFIGIGLRSYSYDSFKSRMTDVPAWFANVP